MMQYSRNQAFHSGFCPSCEAKSGTESLGSRLMAQCFCEHCRNKSRNYPKVFWLQVSNREPPFHCCNVPAGFAVLGQPSREEGHQKVLESGTTVTSLVPPLPLCPRLVLGRHIVALFPASQAHQQGEPGTKASY